MNESDKGQRRVLAGDQERQDGIKIYKEETQSDAMIENYKRQLRKMRQLKNYETTENDETSESYEGHPRTKRRFKAIRGNSERWDIQQLQGATQNDEMIESYNMQPRMMRRLKAIRDN